MGFLNKALRGKTPLYFGSGGFFPLKPLSSSAPIRGLLRAPNDPRLFTNSSYIQRLPVFLKEKAVLFADWTLFVD